MDRTCIKMVQLTCKEYIENNAECRIIIQIIFINMTSVKNKPLTRLKTKTKC